MIVEHLFWWGPLYLACTVPVGIVWGLISEEITEHRFRREMSRRSS